MTYPLATLAPTIGTNGITIPTYNDVYQSMIAIFQNIYGSDIYIAPDSQDGQMIAAFSKAINDSNVAAVALFNSFSPSYATGAQLSSLVKINGLTRLVATNSSAVGNVIGQAGTIIANGMVQDTNGNIWNLPATVMIPGGGSIAVTVIAQAPGAIAATIGSINQIVNPQLGWQSFSNTVQATTGSPVETDAALRLRQQASVSLPALGIIQALSAAIGNIAGVNRFLIYENATGAADANGVPANSIAVIAEGGSAAAIAQAIYNKKSPGCRTYGTTTVGIIDSKGNLNNINFFAMVEQPIYVSLTIQHLTGYVSTTATAIINAITAFINSLAIGQDVYYSQLYGVASLAGQVAAGSENFYITALTLGTAPAPVGTANIIIPYNQAAQMASSANVVLTVV
jgi:uncharacterized phage protein gp47/JayE